MPIQPPIQLEKGFISPKVKQPVREADRSLENGAEERKTWVYTSIPQYAFMA
jgi:hypothetical protein